jgi:hypothetical protein
LVEGSLVEGSLVEDGLCESGRNRCLQTLTLSQHPSVC